MFIYLWCLSGKESACNVGDVGSILGQEGPLEGEMATHSSIPAWEISWTEEPGGRQSVGHTDLSQHLAESCPLYLFHCIPNNPRTKIPFRFWTVDSEPPVPPGHQ